MKFKKSELMQIIKEEIQLQEQKRKKLNESRLRSESTSRVEIKELLSAYHRNNVDNGGAGLNHPRIFKLSFLFPVLERCGLKEIVEDYRKAKRGEILEEGEDPLSLLEEVKQCIDEIRNGDFS